MGFLSFLTRKSSSNQAPTPLLKGQAYESTTASLPPIRGTYPVAGNGPNVLDKLQQAAKKRSLGQLQLVHHDSVTSAPAPSPSVPRFPESVTGRPSSAPGGQRPKSFSRNARSSAAALRPDNDFVQKQLPPVPPIPAHHRRPSSLESQPRFVDILDAQGELGPSNFRSRVAAAGARDYGEDVAERNMSETGCDLQSSFSKASYAHSNCSGQRGSDKVPTAKGHANTNQSNRLRNGRRVSTSLTKGSTASARKTISDSEDEMEFDHVGGLRNNRVRSKRHELRHSNALGIDQRTLKADRRRSFHSLAVPQPKEKSKPRPLSLHHSFSNFDEELLPPMPLNWRATGDDTALQAIGRLEVNSQVDETFDEPAPSPVIPVRPKIIRPKSSSRSDMHSDWQAQSKKARSEKSHVSRPSSSSSVDHSRPRTRSIGVSSVHHLDDITEHIPIRTSSLGVQSQACFTPTTTTSGYSSNPFARPGSQHTPTTSIDISLLAPSEKLGPERDIGSSNPSLDHQSSIYYTVPEDDFSMDIPVSRQTRQDYEVQLETSQDKALHELSNLGDYAAGFTDDSDVDSFVGVTKSSPVGEEGLLFDEGIYNGTSGALPGLFSAFSVPSVPASSGRPRTSRTTRAASDARSLRHGHEQRPSTRSSNSRRRPRSHRRDDSHGLTFNEQDFASFMALDDEILRRAGLMRVPDDGMEEARPRHALYDYSEEGEEDQVDMRATMKMKKDLRRLSTASTTRSRQSRSTYHHRRRDEDGNAADTEE